MNIRTLLSSLLVAQLLTSPALGNNDRSQTCEEDISDGKCYNVPKSKSKKFEQIRNQASEHIDQLNQKLFGHDSKKFENESNAPSIILNEQKIREHGKSKARLPNTIRDQRNQFEEFNKPYELPQKKDHSITYGLGFSMKLDNNSEN